MNFNYKNYVKRFKYEPYKWPPDIALAQLHSRVSEQGPIHANGVECPCCFGRSKQKFTSWWKRDIAEDCIGYGTAVPAYYGLLKFYACLIFVVIMVNTVYPLATTYYVCTSLSGNGACIKVGVLYYLNFNDMIRILNHNGYEQISERLIILQTIVFYLLLLGNIGCLFYLSRMKKLEEKQQQQANHTPPHNALIVHHIPNKQVDGEKFKEIMNLEKVKFQIVKIIKLKPIKTYYELFEQRNKIYYKLLSKYVISEDPKKDMKLNQKLIKIVELLKEQKQKLEEDCFPTHAYLVIFKSIPMASFVHKLYRFTQLNKITFGTKTLVQELGISKEIDQLPITTLKVPEPNEIIWENIGEPIKAKLVGRIKAFIIAIGIIIICYLLLSQPIKWALNSNTVVDNADLSAFEKILPILLSIVMVVLSLLYREYMVVVSRRRNPINELEASKFVLMSTVLFHFVFYLIIPTVFFTISNGIDETVKLYVISEQARTYIIFQMIISFADMSYQMWKKKKVQNLSDQRYAFRYCQKMLHKTVQYRDYPLENRLQAMYRIWSFALFYSFFLPYMMIYMFIAFVALFFLEKRNFYKHYTLRRVISLKLQTTFLTIYVNFFCLYQCFIYCLHVTQTWMYISAISVTLSLLIANFVYWKLVEPARSQKQELKQELLDEKNKEQNNVDIGMINAVVLAEQYEQSYNKFLDSVKNQALDDEIDEYIKELDLPKQQKDSHSVGTQIEMAEPDIDFNDDSD